MAYKLRHILNKVWSWLCNLSCLGICIGEKKERISLQVLNRQSLLSEWRHGCHFTSAIHSSWPEAEFKKPLDMADRGR